jgi:hypothetical protein
MVIDVDLNSFRVTALGKDLQFINTQQNQVDNNVNQALIIEMNKIYNNYGIDYYKWLKQNKQDFLISKESLTQWINQEFINLGLPVINVEWQDTIDNDYTSNILIKINDTVNYTDYEAIIKQGGNL